jgi:hypothetical protein
LYVLNSYISFVHETFLFNRPIISLEQQQLDQEVQTMTKGNNSRINSNSNNKRSKWKHHPAAETVVYGYEQPIPACVHCQTKLQFELQILPSILHILNVDNYHVQPITSTRTNHNNDTTTQTISSNQIGSSSSSVGGMDWGNIAIYTCQNPMCYNRSNIKIVDAFCVIQDSIDPIENEELLLKTVSANRNQPMTTATTGDDDLLSPEVVNHVGAGAATAAIIPDDDITKFNIDNDDDDDDGIVYEGDEVDDDDSVW